MARALALLVPAILLGLLVAVSTPMTGCSGGGGGPTGPGENLCNRISVNGGISITSAPGCTAGNSLISNIERDQFGRVLSLSFDITCTAGASERLVGRVFNITYNNLGQVLSWQATINGRNCSFP